jgi:acyl-CoA reductase-like NAD-dependent aldehyde dehydrogenase
MVVPIEQSPTPTTGREEESLLVLDPATGKQLAEVPVTDPAEVHAAVKAARAAQPAWRALGFRGRRAVFATSRRWLLDNRDRVIDTVVSETGKAREEAVIEFVYMVTAMSYWARTAPAHLRTRRVRSLSPFVLGRTMYTRREPVGVVGVIGPWNNPLINSFGDAIPALAAGNAVILKPSEETPLTGLLMREMIRDCGYPPGVFQVIPGAGATGRALADEADFVMFTGSTATGRKVAARAAERLVPSSLELGGKDALLVLADAPLDRAVNVAVHGAFFNAGQTCTSIERVYVEEPLYEEFVARVRELTEQLTVGRPGGLGTADIGAITYPAQLDVINDHVKDAVAQGARVLTGGRPLDGPGRFYPPTVLVDVDHSMRCMREETFGPTLPIMKVRDAEEAVRLINDSEYGLQANIVTRDTRRARGIAARLKVGAVTVNDTQANYLALGLPMGGWGQSGLGVRHGAEGIRKYTKTQSVMVNKHPLRRDVHMMPFRASGYGFVLRLVDVLNGRFRSR